MNNRRAKIAAGATVVGLAGLGGLALGTNPGAQSLTHQAGSAATGSVVTSSSGATSLAVTPGTARTESRAPIVTRASGGGPSGEVRDD